MLALLTVAVLLGILCSPTTACCCGKPRDCQDIQELGFTTTGVYTIYPEGSVGFKVRCDLDTGFGGWTVVQRRVSSSDFYKTWDEYQVGFGNLDNNYWLGLQQIWLISTQGWYELRIDLTHPNNGSTAHALYNVFSIGGWDTNYKLFVNGYSGTAGDSLIGTHSGMNFTTKDRDNDENSAGNCATQRAGAWWYNSCDSSSLNGDYDDALGNGIIWDSWLGASVSLGESEMKIRRWPHSS